MSNSNEWLESVANRMEGERRKGAAPEPERLTVRKFLDKFDAQRRGQIVVRNIRNLLEKTGLRTEPDFEFEYIDNEISVVSASESSDDPREQPDPTHRIGSLEAAHKKLETVTPNDSLSSAITKMQVNDFSRLPVMTGERDLKGIISWQLIGFRLASGGDCKDEVRHFMERAQCISEDTSLFEAISIVTKHDYVLVRNREQVISGIVTASDLSNQFEKTAGPFLLVGEIEGHLRNLIYGKFTVAEMTGGREITDDGEGVGPADLTFGDYEHLLENPGYWERLALQAIDRKKFSEYLQAARRIRNDIMHFDPDGVTFEDITTLRNFARLLENLAHTGAMR